jgi:hypothetical protein
MKLLGFSLGKSLQRGQTNFLNENYTVSLQTKSNILALSISYHCTMLLEPTTKPWADIGSKTSVN